MNKSFIKSLLLGLLVALGFSFHAEAGWLKRIMYNDIPGTLVTDLFGTNNSGVVVFPGTSNGVQEIPMNATFAPSSSALESSQNSGDYYGSWTPGYIEPPQTGNYIFWIEGDDETQLWLTSDPADTLNPDKKQMICSVPGYSGVQQWDKYAEQQSAAVYLEQGKTYYVEILHKEGNGGDFIGLGWQMPDGRIERPMSCFYVQPTKDTADATLVYGPFATPLFPRSEFDLNIYEGMEVMVYANANVTQPATYTWRKNGQVIADVATSYYRFRAAETDNNAIFDVTITAGGSTVQSGPCYLTVYTDAQAPQLVRASSQSNPTEVRVLFDEDITEATATNLSNFTMSSGTVKSASLASDGRTVVLKMDPMLTPDRVYTVTVRNIQDMASPPNTIAANSSTQFVITDGLISYKIYYTATNSLDNFTNSAVYKSGAASEVRFINTSSYQWNLVPTRDGFQAQMVGYLTPPVTGAYSFGLASDDQGYLFLSSDDTAAKRVRIAYNSGYTSRYGFTNAATQISAPVNLTAGKRYYIEGVFREGTGGDGISIGWQKPGDAGWVNDATVLIPAEYLSVYKSFGAISITNQPKNLTASDGQTATVTTGPDGIDGTTPYFYQWYRDGVAIPGASTGSYTTPRLELSDNGATFQLVVSNYFSSATSAVATLTVTQDVTKPTVVAVGSVVQGLVEARFSEPVDVITATNLANYALQTTSGTAVNITSATIRGNNNAVVVLQTAALTDNATYQLNIQNVGDQSMSTNLMVATNLTFLAYNFEAAVRINNSYNWDAYGSGDQIFITAGGSDIWGTSDQFVYLYKTVTGNFDYRVRGLSFVRSDQNWAKMGLMARLDTAANSRNFFSAATPTNDQNTYTAQIRPDAGVASTSTADANSYLALGLQPGVAARPAVSYPNVWVRLQRIGDVFYYYYSTNGTNWTYWTVVDSASLPAGAMPSTCLLGIALSGHSTSATATGQLTSFGVTPDEGPLAFTLMPTNQTVLESRPVSFTITATGRNPIGYQWLKNGTPIYDATNRTYTIAQTPYADNNALISCQLINGYGQTLTSTSAVLTVIQDTVAPTFQMGQLPRITIVTNEITLLFDEVVDATSAQTLANYTLSTDTGPLQITSAVLGADGRTLVLTTADQIPGKTYTVTVKDVTDIAAIPNKVAPNSKETFFFAGTSGTFVQRADGYVIMEAENATRITAGSDGDLWELRNSPAGYSGVGYMVVPNGRGGGTVGTTASLLAFDIQFNRTGVHTIWLRGWNENTSTAGNDDSVYVGFDGAGVGPGNQASLSGFPASGWTWRSDRQEGTDPVTINVTNVGMHTLNIWHREDGTLADKIVIEPGNRGSGTSAPTPATANGGLGELETQNYAVTPPSAPTVVISSPTNNQTFAAGANVTIEATITAPSTISLVEFFDGTNKLGQVTAAPYTYTWNAVPEGVYSCSVRVTDVLGYIVNSATVRFLVDSSKPVAVATGSLGGQTIGVFFADLSGLDPATATNTANYSINDGALDLTAASLEPDGVTVILTPASAVTGPFTVKVQNVADYGPNVVETTTLTGNVVTFLQHRDIGNPNTNSPGLFLDPVMPGTSLSINANDYYLRGGGSDIWNTNDGMQFLYQTKTGDFDVSLRVETLTRPNEWAKTGLMVREDLDGNSRNFMLLVAPTNGQNLINAQWRDAKGATSASLATAQRITPAPMPNAWLRLQRAGDLYHGYWSTNGSDWTLLYTYSNAVTTPYPATVYVGVPVTSHDNTASVAYTAKAVVRDLQGFDLPVEAPELNIKLVGANIEVSWTASSDQFILYSTTSLSPADWKPVVTPPTVNGNVYTVVVPLSGSTQFFRVQKP